MQGDGDPLSSRTDSPGGDSDEATLPKTPLTSPTHYHADDEEEEVEEEEEEEEEEEGLFDLTIETLTGTTFRVRVSPWETTSGLKSLLQRTEGIPVSQQHLLLGQQELSDDSPLLDQGVREGATLQLVLAMKGGPLNAPRVVTGDDLLWQEVTDYMESNKEELWENLPSGKAVTLLVLRDGDFVNLYKVYENEDGSFSPLNESWGSLTLSGEESSGKAEENARMRSCIKDLKKKMDSVKLRHRRKKILSRSSAHASSVSKSQVPLSANQEERRTSKLSSAPSEDLSSARSRPPIRPSRRPSKVLPLPGLTPTYERDFKGRSASRHTMLEELPHSRAPVHVDFSRRKPLKSIRSQRLNRLDEEKKDSAIQEAASFKSLPLGREAPRPFYMKDPSRTSRRKGVIPLHQSFNNTFLKTSKNHRSYEDRPQTSPEILERTQLSTSSTVSDYVRVRAPDNRLKEIVTILNSSRASSQASMRSKSESSPTSRNASSMKRNGSRRTTAPQSLFVSSLRSKVPSPNDPSTPGTGLMTAGSKEQRDLLREFLLSQGIGINPASRKVTPEKERGSRRLGSGSSRVIATPRKLPSVTPKKKKAKRCSQCNKKLSIVNSYYCRCRKLFCAQHRYAETHSCSFDYKEEGRKLIKMNNPLVEPQKLPKI